jgi:lysylphosphatidylglycerol synthetase-like protein (DUF2156 family)
VTRGETSSERRLRLVETYGYNGFALLTLYDGWRFYEPPDIDGFIAYELHRKTALVSGDPVCAEDTLAALLTSFVAYCEAQRWRFAFVAASARVGKIAADLGYKAVKIGEEPFLDLTRRNFQGNAAKKARSAINHGRRVGVVVEEYRQASPAVDNELDVVAEEWLNSRRAPAMGFIMRSRLLDRRELKRIFLARYEGRIVAAITCAPAPARGLLYVEELVRRPDAPYGASELLIAAAYQAAADEGAALFGLGLAPLQGATSQPYGRFKLLRTLINLIYKRGNYVYGFRSLNHFKKKFAPSVWEDSFFIYQNRLLPVSLAVVAAFAPDGIAAMVLPQRLQWLRRMPALALWLAAAGGILASGFAAWEFPVLRMPVKSASGAAGLVSLTVGLLRGAADATLLEHRVISSAVVALLAASMFWRRRARA